MPPKMKHLCWWWTKCLPDYLAALFLCSRPQSETRCWRQAPEGSVWEANFPPFPHSTQSKWGHLKECSLKNKPNIFSISNGKCLYTTYWNFSLWPQARKFRPPMSPCLKLLGHSIFFGFCSKETWHFLSASLLLSDYGVASAEAWQNYCCKNSTFKIEPIINYFHLKFIVSVF